MARLALSVDDQVVQDVEFYAAQRGMSVSQLVERWLYLVARPPRASHEDPPVLRMLRGAARGVDPEDHRRHLLEKYR